MLCTRIVALIPKAVNRGLARHLSNALCGAQEYLTAWDGCLIGDRCLNYRDVSRCERVYPWTLWGAGGSRPITLTG